MPLTSDTTVFQKRLAALPLETYQAGETVLTAGSTTGRLLILKEGAVEIVKEGVEIAKVTEPGAVFGELSVLLDKPHTADMRALEISQFHVADAAALLMQDPTALLYVAAVLARRLDGANQALIEVKHQLQDGQPRSVVGKTIEKMEGLLGAGGASSSAIPLTRSPPTHWVRRCARCLDRVPCRAGLAFGNCKQRSQTLAGIDRYGGLQCLTLCLPSLVSL